ncbi:MAG TPA: YtxH domain-containing protein [Ktedonobacteraceae bacterium]|nr:YtxH domain-containing protein [Ktedonobacteraceae bacterium]
MNKFLTGALIGVGIGMLLAPMPGQQMRQMLGERLQELGGQLSSNEQLNQIVRQAMGPESPVERGLKNLANRATTPDAADTLVENRYRPSYPEYVDPNLKA